ncbi:VOC family protein [Aurantimonas sp. A3-2-R12]|uniref:VOC family protein n=1 Tax=Aurantimonas sp. A3-2-R12 TaxID=3114362 RepID=UPI002E177C80|nr:VOC family protein [Aurantimonas sp. A3-2-R12]
MRNFVVWFDIPVRDLDRSVKFYAEVIATDLAVVEGAPGRQANFPFAPGIASGSLRENKEHKPGATGTMVYLDGGDDLSVPLARVEAAGGTVIKGKTAIGPNGFMAIFKDCDGNTVALHSRN